MARDRLVGKKTLQVGNFLDEYEKDDLKKQVDLLNLFRYFGAKPVKKGKNWVARCIFGKHEDKEPSLFIDSEKGFYNCFGCNTSGDHFTLVMTMKGCGFKEALQFLKEFSGKDFTPGLEQPEENTEPEKHIDEKEKSNLHPTTASLDIVTDFYHKKIYENKTGMNYLTKTRKIDPALIKRFKIGYANGSLLKIISNGQKEAFKDLGIIKITDQGKIWELFSGCLTFPVFDEAGKVVHMYGRKTDPEAKQPHFYLTGRHKSIFNRKACRVYDTIILVESILDCLSLITMGIENVQPLYGVGSFTKEHLQILKDDRVKTIILGMDNDAAGRTGIEKHKKTLLKEGFTVKVITPPGVKDWNDCLLAGTGKEAVEKIIANALPERLPDDDNKVEFKAEKQGIKHIFTIGKVIYRLTGIKEIFVSSLRVQIKAEYKSEPHWDGLDLYSSKSRIYYSNKLADFYDIEAKIVEKHLIMILEYLEDERDKKLNDLQGKNEKVELTEEDKKLGMDFLTSPDMFDQITKDMEILGYVGEELNKQLLYTAATSRKLDDPVSILIISSSSAGKSYLVDTVKRLMPDEDVLGVTSLSDQALNYIPDGGLLNKFLILGEAVHSEVINHQIRDMLSEHRLSRLVPVKDEKTGKMITETITTECIVALVMSSTRHDINPENASRCFVINADETPAQTKKIHTLQRNKYTLKRYYEKKHVIPEIIKKHHAAQRLLRKVIIVNPFSNYLNFPHQRLRTRRDHDRFIDLIACICFVRQYQKEAKIKPDEHTGEQVEYIRCDLVDYAIAYNIMINGVLASTFAELPKSTVRLYEEVRDLFHKAAKKAHLRPLDISITQQDIRARIKWIGRESIKKGLRKLVYLEYLQTAKGGNRGMRNTYKLIADEPVEKLDCTMIPTPAEINKLIAKEEEESDEMGIF